MLGAHNLWFIALKGFFLQAVAFLWLTPSEKQQKSKTNICWLFDRCHSSVETFNVCFEPTGAFQSFCLNSTMNFSIWFNQRTFMASHSKLMTTLILFVLTLIAVLFAKKPIQIVVSFSIDFKLPSSDRSLWWFSTWNELLMSHWSAIIGFRERPGPFWVFEGLLKAFKWSFGPKMLQTFFENLNFEEDR